MPHEKKDVGKDNTKKKPQEGGACSDVFYIHPIPPIYIMGKSCCVCASEDGGQEAENEHCEDDQQHDEAQQDCLEQEKKKREKICEAREQYNSRYDNFYNNYNIGVRPEQCEPANC